MIDVCRGHRAVVVSVSRAAEVGHPADGASPAHETAVRPTEASTADIVETDRILHLHVRRLGAHFARFSAEADLTNGADLRRLLIAAVRRWGRDPAKIDEYEMDIRRRSDTTAIMTFVTSPIRVSRG
jgi:hypothetical protein